MNDVTYSHARMSSSSALRTTKLRIIGRFEASKHERKLTVSARGIGSRNIGNIFT